MKPFRRAVLESLKKPGGDRTHRYLILEILVNQFYTHNLETFFGENPQPISLFINYSFTGQNFILSWKVILINKMRVSLTSQVYVARPHLEKQSEILV